MKTCISGRPTEVPESDVYICESKYQETEKTVRKLNKGLKVQPDSYSNTVELLSGKKGLYFCNDSI
ncbi:hypothetical protein DPMN_118639 [Dreissena polymorpha]|uniref:Uncharacterized protein n=1 Tax=Dreissena polymorpha TaxID=45954 RepID=A0A9D4GL36_DREPO|nr:hypothetical protein DPMN_118639 [Dreissena polymorpha]